MEASSLNPGLHFGCSKSIPLNAKPIITLLALAVLATSAVVLCANLGVMTNVNATTHWALVGTGAGSFVTAIILGVAHFAHLKHARREALKDITTEELNAKLLEISQQKNPMAALHQLADDLPFEKLDTYFKENFGIQEDSSDAFKEVQSTLRRAHKFLDVTVKASPSAKSRALGVLDSVLGTVDSFFVAFGIAEFFDPPEGKFDSGFKFQKIIMLVSVFTLLTSTLLPMLGATNGSAIVGSSLLTICILSLIWPRIRPMPSSITAGENWTQKARNKTLPPASAPQVVLEELSQKLANPKAHVLIMGDSGIGKTVTARAFTHAAEDGTLPTWGGKTVFYFNVADLVTKKEAFSGENNILTNIRNAIPANKRENAILVLDEFHQGFAGEHKTFGEKLKTFLDEFPYVIAITTAEEYSLYIYTENAAADRRFDKLRVAGTDRNGTLTVLSEHMTREGLDVVLDDIDVLHHIWEKTKGEKQPLTALHILSKCITKISSHRSELAQQAQTLRNQLDAADGLATALGSAAIRPDQKVRIQTMTGAGDESTITREEIMAQLTALEEQIAEEKIHLAELEETKKRLVQVRKDKFALVQKFAELEKEKDLPEGYQALLAEFILVSSFEKTLEDKIKQLAADHHIKAILSKALVDEVLAEEKENKKMCAAALQRAAQQRQARLEQAKVQSTTESARIPRTSHASKRRIVVGASRDRRLNLRA